MWESVNEFKNAEKTLAQSSVIEEQIRRTERVLSDEKRVKSMDEQDLQYYTNRLALKKELLNTMLGKLSMTPDFYKNFGDQKFITANQVSKDKKGKRVYKAYEDVIVRSKSGKIVKRLSDGDTYTMRKNDVVVINPIEIVPITSYSAISGLAHAKTVLGAEGNILDADLIDPISGGKGEWLRIVDQTRAKINSHTYNFMRKKGLRDWTEHSTEVQRIIDEGLQRVVKITEQAKINEPEGVDTWHGNVPKEYAEYGKTYLLSLLAHGESGNKVHYLPNSNQLVHAIRIPSSTLIKGVFDAIKTYQIEPDHKAFLTSYAKDHRAWFDALTQNEGFERAFRQLSNSDLGTSLMASNVHSTLNSPFLPREQYKKFTEYMDLQSAVGSEFAELYRQIIQDRVMVDPITARLLKEKFIYEMELQEKGSGHRKFRELMMVSRGTMVFDGMNTTRYGAGRGEGLTIGEILSLDPRIDNNILTGVKRPSGKKKISELIDSVVGDSNTATEKILGQTREKCKPGAK
jgi:hypothetical protein